jgi:MFS family permease
MADKATVEAQPRRRFATFSSLRYRNYRYLWFAQIGRAAAMWMEQIARPVLILQLTDSGLMLGLVVAVRMAPQLLFGLLSGVAADRFDRKRILLAAQWVTMASHLMLAALVLTDVVQVWHVFALAFVTGTSMVFNQTSRQSIIPQVVPREDLLNAVALNTAALNIMRIAGPTLAGVILFSGNVGPVYLVSGFLGVGVIACISLVQIQREPRRTDGQVSWLDDLREGLGFAIRKPALLAVLGPPLIIFVFGLPYLGVFVPLFAKRVLDLGDSGVAALVVAAGAGALLGSLFLASQTQLRRRGLLLLTFMALFSIGLILFSRSTLLPLSIVALMGAASMSTSYMALTNSLLLELSPSDMHGRVMSLMSLDRGLVPWGRPSPGRWRRRWGRRTACW